MASFRHSLRFMGLFLGKVVTVFGKSWGISEVFGRTHGALGEISTSFSSFAKGIGWEG